MTVHGNVNVVESANTHSGMFPLVIYSHTSANGDPA